MRHIVIETLFANHHHQTMTLPKLIVYCFHSYKSARSKTKPRTNHAQYIPNDYSAEKSSSGRNDLGVSGILCEFCEEMVSNKKRDELRKTVFLHATNAI